jgi:hypothetical protein
LTSEGKPFARERFKEIIMEQVTLGYLTKGGVSYSDSEQMSPHERKLALDAIKEILDTQAESYKKILDEAKSK